MNVLKVFSVAYNAGKAQRLFVEDNYFQVLKSDMHGKVSLLGDQNIYFKVVTTMEDCHLLSGIFFSWVEYYYEADDEIKYWIMSRVRGV